MLGTNADKPLLKRISQYMVPVYDYCLVTEPLSSEQLDRIGWANRQGLVRHHQPVPLLPAHRRQPDPVGRLRRDLLLGIEGVDRTREPPRDLGQAVGHFFETFPQLDDVQFTHTWGGAIDTSTRFSVFFGSAMSNRVVYALGYTGLGVAATRFAASTMLDLLAGRKSIATQTDFVKEKPLPFPPEPFRFIGIQATRWSLDREDKTGKRNAWLRTLDRMGLGFDS